MRCPPEGCRRGIQGDFSGKGAVRDASETGRSTRWALPRPLLRAHLPLVRPVGVTPLAVVEVRSTMRDRRPARCPIGEALTDPIPVPWRAEEPKATQADRPVAPKGGHHR